MKTLRGLILSVVVVVGVFTGGAYGAPAPTPGLKALALSAPTNLPPEQSETERVTVEAGGGDFRLGYPGEVKEETALGTPIVEEGSLSFTGGSPVATIESVGAGTAFVVGDRVTFAEEYEPGVERIVVSCSADCEAVGSTVTFSEPAAATVANAPVQIFTKQLAGVSAPIQIGQEVEGTFFAYFPAGTVIDAVDGETVTLSNPTTDEYLSSEGEISFTAKHVKPEEMSAPIAYDASALEVQEALHAIPRFGPESLVVRGGPGGDAEHPYFVEFGGPLADQDIEEITVDAGGLLDEPGEHPFVHVFTTVPGGAGTGEIVVLPANIGGAPTNTTITATVGPLPHGIVTAGPGTGTEWHCPGEAGETTVTCFTNKPLRILHSTPYTLNIPIEVVSGAVPKASVRVELSDTGASAPSVYQVPIVVSKKPASFGIAADWAGSFEADGSPSVQAGGHPYASAAYVMLNTVRNSTGGITPAGDSKDVVVDLPPGFVGNPLASKRCPQSTLMEPEHGSDICDNEMAVGNLDPLIGALNGSLPFESHLYDDMPPHGVAAEFTTKLAFPLQSVLANLNSEEDFGIRLTGPNNPNFDKIYGAFTAFEGVPAEGNGKALLTNPTNCAESAAIPPLVKGTADTFQNPGVYAEPFEIEQPALTGCESLEFVGVTPQTPEGQVSFNFLPTSEGSPVNSGSTPVGATAHLHIDQGGLTDPSRLATPELKRAVIKLPAGLSLNPSSANGLKSCSEAQIGYRGKGFEMPNPIRFNEAQPTCPDGSKLGTAEIKTPLLENPLVGTVYLAAQEENPFGSLIAIYLVVNDPFTGILIKLPGEVQADPTSGRLTTVFDNDPQLPFEDLILQFRGGGPRSEFATSEVCGSFPTEGEWTPWSAPESGPPALTNDSFSVSTNCSSSPTARPFSPSFEAGTTGTQAGAYSPLVIKINRKDGEQELTSLNFTLPKGLIGKLAGIPYCSDQAIASAEGKTGKEEQANPSCPGASQLGSVDTSAGVGSEPFHVAGHLYLAGPYKGAPVSSVVITPAVAGPLDLGNVVVRAPLYIDRETAALTAKSDPIPTILKGIPLKVRSVAINVDKPGFILNPTNCAPMTASASIGGGSGATATPSNRFQVAGCKELKFAPKLKVALKGKTKRNGKPALTATVNQPFGQANIGFVSVALPHSEFLEQAHIRTVCTRVQFAAEQCPAAAIYGHAEAVTPLLDQPLTGPVYLRSSSHRLPDLVAVLKGPPSQPIEIDLDGRIDSFHGGIRTTFEAVPDAPVSKFVLKMQGGNRGLLVNSTNICKGTHKAIVEMTAQSAKDHNFLRKVEPQCGKKKKGSKKPAKGGKKSATKPKAK